jgi:hypothetical protein
MSGCQSVNTDPCPCYCHTPLNLGIGSKNCGNCKCNIRTFSYNDRIENIEKEVKNLHEINRNGIDRILPIIEVRTLKHIEGLEKTQKEYLQEIAKLMTRISSLELKCQVAFLNINEQPYNCPVCEGNRTHKRMIKYFDKLINIEDNCICCEGKGIVWK